MRPIGTCSRRSFRWASGWPWLHHPRPPRSSARPEDKQGVASAVNDTAREVGGALGIAVLGSVLADHVGPHTDPLALVGGFHAALHVGAAALIIGALAVFRRAPRRALALTRLEPVLDVTVHVLS